jgi:hypothetical protein
MNADDRGCSTLDGIGNREADGGLGIGNYWELARLLTQLLHLLVLQHNDCDQDASEAWPSNKLQEFSHEIPRLFGAAVISSVTIASN